MKGIELAINEDGQLSIRCLQHNVVHTGPTQFCCNDVMIRAMSMAIQKSPDGFRARLLGPSQPSGLTGLLFEIATAPLFLNSSEGGISPIDQN